MENSLLVNFSGIRQNCLVDIIGKYSLRRVWWVIFHASWEILFPLELSYASLISLKSNTTLVMYFLGSCSQTKPEIFFILSLIIYRLFLSLVTSFWESTKEKV